MGKRNTFWARNSNRRVRSKDKGSDESDDDYVISDEDEEDSDSDLKEYSSSDGSDAVEEEDVEKPKVKTGLRGNLKITGCKSRKMNQVVSDDKDEEDGEKRNSRKVVRRSNVKVESLKGVKNRRKGCGKRRRVLYVIEDEHGEMNNVSHEKEDDVDYKDEEDDEFTADEDISLDEEEEETIAFNKIPLKVCKKNKKRQRSGERLKRRKKSSVAKTSLTKGRKRRGRKKKKKEIDDDFVDDPTKSSRPRRSDSDTASSGESDYEYTISEEEREQVREAGRLLRSKYLPVKKGEKKVEKREMMKNVCGICLSEEDIRILKGTLDCCNHYFCFTCITEWSKVESRCPLCKQRFRSISKLARSTLGVDLRAVVIHVPERDQVYEPTEEELRNYFDPYANIICRECHEGEDDGLMLLCDLCDSSAHTYCVGLGREVPEGNWYCQSCRDAEIEFSFQTQFQDASFLVSSTTPMLPYGDVEDSSSLEATTLSRRRTLHRHIQTIINSSRASETLIANLSDGFVATQIGHGIETEPSEPAATQIGHDRETEPSQPAATQIDHGRETEPTPEATQISHGRETELSQPATTQETRMSMSEERLQLNSNSLISVHDSELSSPSSMSILGDRHVGLGQELSQVDTLSGNQQNLPTDMPNTMSSTGEEHLQQRVITHLRNLSSKINLGEATFEEISTSSINTILSASGLEHKSSEVNLVPPPVTCHHPNMTLGNSLMKGCCYSCFDSFVEDVVKMILYTRQPDWLKLGLH